LRAFNREEGKRNKERRIEKGERWRREEEHRRMS
jgi:hypothetical protein